MQTYIPLVFFGWILGAPLLGAIVDLARTKSEPRREPALRQQTAI